MNAATPPAGFTEKWRARWPEWNIGSAFVPAARRESAYAWFALLDECSDAAWAGADATPGLAKLAWWCEELQGWSKGARRHPLGETLQRVPAPWAALAAELRALPAQRETALAQAEAGLAALAAVLARCEQAVLGGGDSAAAAPGIVHALLAARALVQGDAAMATALLHDWPACRGARPRRLQSAFLHARLQRAAGARPTLAASPWRSLLLAWAAARRAAA